MRRLITPVRISVLALLALIPVGISDVAWATTGPAPSVTEVDSNTSAKVDGDTVSATAGGVVVFDTSKNGSGKSAGAVTSATSWTPPACYYAPKYTPKGLEAEMQQVWSSTAPSHEWILNSQNYFVNGDPYKDFNKDKAGKGYWWDAYVAQGREADPAAQDCDKEPFWVDNGAAPPADVPQAITPEMLAQLAYAEIRVPSTQGRTRSGEHHEGEPSDLGVAGYREVQAGLRHRFRPAARHQRHDHRRTGLTEDHPRHG